MMLLQIVCHELIVFFYFTFKALTVLYIYIKSKSLNGFVLHLDGSFVESFSLLIPLKKCVVQETIP